MEFRPVGGDTPVDGGQAQPDSPALSLEVPGYDVEAERREMTRQLENSREIDSIVSQINAYEVNSVVTFGNETAAEVSRVSDQVLKSVNIEQINESGRLLESLGRIMESFDLQEVAKPPRAGLLGKVLGGAEKQLDRLLEKYNGMGDELDRIYVELKRYESQIQQSNKSLDKLFDANVGYYKNLVKYILAGEQGVKELGEHIENLRAEYERTKDQVLSFDLHSMEGVKVTLEQRVMDLRLAEHVAMQSIPMIRSMQMGNLNLIRKINSAFIVTLPVFKQALAQAVLLKRQRIQAEAMRALDARTGEMLIKNAQNMAEQAKMNARLGDSGAIKIETLEQTWQTIVQGIRETQVIQEDARRGREEDSRRLGRLMAEYESHLSG